MPDDEKHWRNVELRRTEAEAQVPHIQEEVRRANELVASLFNQSSDDLAPIQEEEEE